MLLNQMWISNYYDDYLIYGDGIFLTLQKYEVMLNMMGSVIRCYFYTFCIGFS